MHTCVVCGKHFDAVRKDAKYCSPACRSKAYRDRVRTVRTAAPKLETTLSPEGEALLNSAIRPQAPKTAELLKALSKRRGREVAEETISFVAAALAETINGLDLRYPPNGY